MIQERIRAGLARAKEQGVTLGRRRVACDERGILKTAGYSGRLREGFPVGVIGHSGVSLNTFCRFRPSAMT